MHPDLIDLTGVSRNAVLTGVGSWLPPTQVPNRAVVSERLDTLVRERIGIRSRHRVDPGMATGDMAVEAGMRALKSAGVEQVDAVVLATTTPDRPVPATAPDVASRLGLGTVAAFDLGAGCSGFLYGCGVASGLIASGTARRVLVIAADSMTTITNPKDPSTAPLFGDGAGAVVLECGAPGTPGALGPMVWGSDGELGDAIMLPAGGSRQRSAGTETAASDHFVHMRGTDVFRHAVRRMSQAAREAVRGAGWSLAEVDRFIAHQGNAAITAAVADTLRFPPDRMPSNIASVGNTAAASIPLLLADAAASGAVRGGDKVLLVAFGSGLTWAATTLIWPTDCTALL
ncbi:beta-ketoacyl-ACP synthase III [Streptomyces sp. NPDC019396]|uniref:beta-ketoacyl-ACP synthase III n=1 Tax=Streptomyces sp. NPDC019396 TaxID=3154687 RepID=UPI0033D46E1F